jgi:uncharacterized membrane protein
MAPRAAYIHVGVLLGTLMTGNVWFVIIPSQRDLIAATRAGRPQDRELSMRAKERSIHNNYMTFPLIFIMVSNHFPAFYSHQYAWLNLTALMAGGALVRHFMNVRWSLSWWRWGVALSGLVSLGAVYWLTSMPASDLADDDLAQGPVVGFEEVQAILATRCVPCHGIAPSDTLFPTPPGGLVLETPAQIKAAARRIRVRVEGQTMPFRNRTHMTDDERVLVARWVAQGADLHAASPDPAPEVTPAENTPSP